MALLDELDRDDLVFWGGVAFVAYIVWNTWRDQTASGDPGVFSSSAPASNPVTKAIEFLDPMQVSPSGVNFIMEEEGFSPTIKNDAGHNEIGYGHDIVAGDNITPPITRTQGATILNSDLAKVASALNGAVTANLSQDQFDALASWTLNVGIGAMQKSTLVKQLNAGNYSGAASEFSRWNQSQGKVNNSLVTRRENEQALFNSV
jgi:lysozyme